MFKEFKKLYIYQNFKWPTFKHSCTNRVPTCVIVHVKGCVLSAQTELFVSSLRGLIDHAGGSGFINRPHPLLSPGKERGGVNQEQGNVIVFRRSEPGVYLCQR